MFNLAEFIVENLINGVQNGSFTRERANILGVNYFAKGFLTEDDLIAIDEGTMPIVEEATEEIEEVEATVEVE